MNKLGFLFNVREGEGRLVSLLVIHSFFVGIAQILLRTTATTLFLEKYSSQALPYVYIGSAIAAPLAGLLYTRFEKRIKFEILLRLNLGLLLLALLAFRLLILINPESAWPTLVLYIYYYVQDALINLEFWALVSHLLDVRQGKRLFGLVSSGEMVARIIGGFSISGLVRWFAVPDLLWLALIGILGSIAMLFIINRSHPLITAGSSEPKSRGRTEPSRLSFLKNRYILLLVALSVLALIGYYFVDLIYISQVRAQYPTSANLAGFLGIIEASTSILTLVVSLFITGPLISRSGVIAGLLALPGITIYGVSVLLYLSATNAPAYPIFAFAVLTKLLFITFRKSTDKTAARVLYQPLPSSERLQAQTLIGSVVEPGAAGIAGIALLLLPTNITLLTSILVVVLAAWITTAILMNRQYTASLMNALNRRILGEQSFEEMDASSMAALRKGLESPFPGEVLYYLNILEGIGDKSYSAYLQKLLYHPAPEVRLEVLRKIERLGIQAAMRRVRDRLRLETNPQVQGETLRALASLGEVEVIEQIVPHLESQEPQIKMGAMVGLLRSGGIEGILAAGEKLIESAASPNWRQRRFAAQVLGEVGIKNFYRPLLDLLADTELNVRREAMNAAGKLNNPKFWPLLLDNLAVPGVRVAAMNALISGGDSVVGFLNDNMDPENLPRDTQIRMMQICGRIGSEKAVVFLRSRMDIPDADIYLQLLRSLRTCGYHAAVSEHPEIEGRIRQEAAGAAWILSSRMDLMDESNITLLQTALEHAYENHLEKLFLLLSYLYDPKAVMNAWNTLFVAQETTEKRAYAQEVVDLLVSREIKPFILPLLENISLPEKLRRLGEFFPISSGRLGQRLREFINGPYRSFNLWLKICALWTLSGINPEVYDGYIKNLRASATPQAEDILKLLVLAPMKERVMLSTIEKLIILKTVNIFSETPDEILAEVASAMEENEIKAGESIYKKGDVGKNLYIIVTGSVLIMDDQRQAARLEDRDILGELAILDPQPQPSSAVAATDVHLLSLNQEFFTDLMLDRIEVARGIIRVLARRLRGSIQEQFQPAVENPSTISMRRPPGNTQTTVD